VCGSLLPRSGQGKGEGEGEGAGGSHSFRSCFKLIGDAYTNVIVTKKLKSAGGTATPTATLGVADDVIHVDDTITVPITQFSFTPKQIRERFNGDENFLLRGHYQYQVRRRHSRLAIPKGRVRAVREAQAVEEEKKHVHVRTHAC
jgi:hypothetical protein